MDGLYTRLIYGYSRRPMECYSLSRADLERGSPFPVRIVADHAAANAAAARMVVDLVCGNAAAGRDTSLVLPVGPLLYEPLAELCNRERVPLARLTIFMMDEYLRDDAGAAVSLEHPLSFRGFMRRSLVERLDPALGFSEERLVFPLPNNLEQVSARIAALGGVDLCFAGIGITGHIAFNDPPEPEEHERDLEWMRSSPARIVTINRESTTQMAVGGTHGNWSIIPRRACTLGMRELLVSRRICVVGMRSWHAGTVRRAFFGPVSRDCPASLLQEHPSVELLLTELAAKPPAVSVTLDTGEEAPA